MPLPPASPLGLSLSSGSGLGAATASATALPPPPLSSMTSAASLPPMSAQHSRDAARQLERDRRVMGSPENRRTPATAPLPSALSVPQRHSHHSVGFTF